MSVWIVSHLIIINPRYLKQCVQGEMGVRKRKRKGKRRRLSVES